MTTTKISLRLPTDDLEALDELAAEQERNRCDVLRRLVRQAIRDREQAAYVDSLVRKSQCK